MQEIRFHRSAGRWGCLASHSPHPIRLDGAMWPTVEHFMLAQRFPGDPAIQHAIRGCATSGRAARIAVRERARGRSDWADARDALMYRAQLAKFTQHESLRERLMDSGRALLVQHAHGAPYWGDAGDGTGQNMLGRTLMVVREELRRSSRQESADGSTEARGKRGRE